MLTACSVNCFVRHNRTKHLTLARLAVQHNEMPLEADQLLLIENTNNLHLAILHIDKRIKLL